MKPRYYEILKKSAVILLGIAIGYQVYLDSLLRWDKTLGMVVYAAFGLTLILSCLKWNSTFSSLSTFKVIRGGRPE